MSRTQWLEQVSHAHGATGSGCLCPVPPATLRKDRSLGHILEHQLTDISQTVGLLSRLLDQAIGEEDASEGALLSK